MKELKQMIDIVCFELSKQDKWLTISNNEKRSEINLKLTMAKRTACLATDGAKSEIV